MRPRSLSQLDVTRKMVVVRADFDVSLKDGKVKDDFRIRAVLPTLQYLVRRRAKVIVISHLGRPKGWDETLSLEPVARHLAELLKRKLIVLAEEVTVLPEYPIPHVYFFKHNLEKSSLSQLTSKMGERNLALLENLRFYPGEEQNDPGFAEKLAALGSVYINDAFASSHRSHASIVGIAELLPAAAGLRLEKEINSLTRAIDHPPRPVVLMMGGIKLADKARALRNLGKISDYILLGGGLANLFLKIQGYQIGKSVWQEKGEETVAKGLWRDYKEQIKLPIDVVVSTSYDGLPECLPPREVKSHQLILDIGPRTIETYSSILKRGKTLIWSGPMGYFENKTYSHGTASLGWLFASRSSASAYGVAGGGQTLEVIKNLQVENYIDHVSTGGGAMLEFLAGGTLPGIEVLKEP